MNVLLVSEPGVDGVFRYVETLCRFLWTQGVMVHLAYSDCRAGPDLHELVREVEARCGRTLNLRTSNRPALADARALAALIGLAREIRPDVIHTHSAKAGGLGRMLRLCGIRAVQCYHPHAYVGMRPRPGRLDGVYNLIETLMGRLAHTIVVSSDEAEFARRRLRVPESKLHLIPNGVDLRLYSPASAARSRMLRRQFGLPDDVPVLGCMGRSSEQKDPITLYRAFARAAAACPMVLFHVGHGELDGALDGFVRESGLGKRIFRLPQTTTPADFYRTVDGFILTSWYEGFSLAALEALATNLPLILSDAPGNRDLLRHPLSHAWSAAPGDSEAFAACLVDWCGRVRRGTGPINHREIAQRHFDVQARCAAVLRLYRRLLGTGQGMRERRWARVRADERREERVSA